MTLASESIDYDFGVLVFRTVQLKSEKEKKATIWSEAHQLWIFFSSGLELKSDQ